MVCDDVLKKAVRTSDKDNEMAIEVLRHLSWAIRRNRHLVFFPTLSLALIERLGQILNKNETAAIRHAFARRQDLKQMTGIVHCHVEVSFEEETHRAGDTIYVNARNQGGFELFEECHFLTENLLDAEFYKFFASVYQKMNRIDECVFKTTYFPLQGGGATIKQVYKYECETGNHFCLAILDSDKKWPNYDGYGETARSFEEEYNDYVKRQGVPLACHYYVMEKTSEIENLIPIDILKVYSSSDQKSFLASHQKSMPYFDIKKGLEYRLFYEKDDALIEWRKEFPAEIDWPQLIEIKSKSVDGEDYDNQLKRAGFKPIVQPWGANILDRVLNPERKYKSQYDLKKINTTRMLQAQQNEWNIIGQLVFSWCCCFVRTMF